MRQFIIVIIAICTSILSYGFDFEVNGLYYNILTNNEVEVVRDGNNFYQQTTITIPKTVKNNGTTYNVTHIAHSAFWKCPNLTSITIAESITTITDQAINDCPNLTTIVFNAKNCTHNTNTYLFCNLQKLSMLTIGNKVQSLPAGFIAYGNFQNLKTISIPNSVKTIGAQAFQGCSHLTSITLGSGLTKIENATFYGCSNLKSITIPNSVISIEENAFGNCTGLTSITIPLNVTTLGGTAFAGCTNLKILYWNAKDCSITYSLYNNANQSIEKVVFGSQVEKVPAMFLMGDTKLNEVVLPNSITEIGRLAFMDCSSITRLVLPDSNLKIKAFAFNNCSKIESVELPVNLAQIDTLTFGACDGLKSVTYNTTNPIEIGYWQYGVYYNPFSKNWGYSLSNVELIVPENAIETFLAMDGWREFKLPYLPNGTINNISPSDINGHKIFSNGQLFIIYGDKTYTMQGAKVK